MRNILLWPLVLIVFACSDRGPEFSTDYKAVFDSILHSYDLQGTLLVFDPQKETYYSNDFERAAEGFLPASTFKIPNTIIALETGVMNNAETLIRWDGQKRAFETWEQDMTLKEAFRASCVPCFQEIARQIGQDRMKAYLNKLRYAKIEINDDIDQFWLAGNSRISPFEQIDFLTRFYNKKLPILTTTREQMLRILEIESHEKYIFSGKTGWSNQGKNNGWFVGFLEEGKKIYYFALNIDPIDAQHMQKFVTGREQAVRDALHRMNIM